ncbi:MAG: pyridoxine 5-phosphate synthase [Polaromonas sp.]|jgi:pyridoxine 5-phosphate synthase|nr:pyridoxine 5-phosphate synthase [Polaromonas sp.]
MEITKILFADPKPAATAQVSSTARTHLSVNVNKVALLRNTRHLGIPDVVRAARICLEAGASGITVHPRPDERHIRSDDVFEIAAMMKDWPDREFNIEGNPFQNLMQFVRDLSARGLPLHQCTFVPDSEDQLTSDHGWSFPDDAARLVPLIEQAHSRGVRVSLFMDPVADAMAAAKATGADRVEFYTETFARAWADEKHNEALAPFVQAARAAAALNLGINAGHDLNRDNLTAFLKAVPWVREVSIGHALIADALELGYEATVKDYLRCIDEAFASA